MSWPLFVAVFAGVLAYSLYSEKIKRDAQKKDFGKDVPKFKKSRYLKK